MNNSKLVEKLALQVESFQEGFEILCESFTIEEMIRNFIHLLRGNFIIANLKAYYKDEIGNDWVELFPGKNDSFGGTGFLKSTGNLTIEYFKESDVEVSFVLPLSDKSSLGVLMGKKMDASPFNDLDKITLQIMLQIFDSAHRSFLNQKKEKELIFDLNEKVLHLNNLIDTVIEISKFNNIDILYELSLERIASLTNASASVLRIYEKDKETSVFSFPPGIINEKIFIDAYKLENSFKYGEEEFKFSVHNKETRNGSTYFSDLDQLLFDAIVRQVKASLDNQYLNKQAIEKEKIEKELSVAASIQQRIIPESLPDISGYDLAGINIPSREVGGDYYDCIALSEGKFALIIADVAGKGIGAALLVSTLNAALYSYLQFEIPLTEMADRLNKLIYKSSPPDKYITFFIAVLDSGSGELDMVNAGHNPIFIQRNSGTLEKIEAGGVGLGMFDFGIPFAGQKTTIHKGDRLFLYTDGIPEAMNEREEEYSDEKMIEFFLAQSKLTSNQFIEEIVRDVKKFTGDAIQSDDITALILTRK